MAFHTKQRSSPTFMTKLSSLQLPMARNLSPLLWPKESVTDGWCDKASWRGTQETYRTQTYLVISLVRCGGVTLATPTNAHPAEGCTCRIKQDQMHFSALDQRVGLTKASSSPLVWVVPNLALVRTGQPRCHFLLICWRPAAQLERSASLDMTTIKLKEY